MRDTGAGMPPELAEQAFQRYVQGSTTDRRGAGLGLYFCRLVAEAHTGQIRLTSAVGIGTSVVVVLPVERPA